MQKKICIKYFLFGRAFRKIILKMENHTIYNKMKNLKKTINPLSIEEKIETKIAVKKAIKSSIGYHLTKQMNDYENNYQR